MISILTHTDFDDPPKAFGEARRVLRRGGTFVYAGVHPCFGSPFVERRDGIAVGFRRGYRTAGWHRLPPDTESTKIRARVGIHHVPLAGLLNAIACSGFTITGVEEPGDADPPLFLALRSTAT